MASPAKCNSSASSSSSSSSSSSETPPRKQEKRSKRLPVISSDDENEEYVVEDVPQIIDSSDTDTDLPPMLKVVIWNEFSKTMPDISSINISFMSYMTLHWNNKYVKASYIKILCKSMPDTPCINISLISYFDLSLK